MDHVAIMKISWGLLQKILDGRKVIESRWYKNRSAPWGKIEVRERIFFKDSGKPITALAIVKKVLHFENLTPLEVKKLLNKYHQLDGIEKNKITYFYKLFKNKRHCILVFLKNPKKIRPFSINKKGFGLMSAWISTENIKNIKLVR